MVGVENKSLSRKNCLDESCIDEFYPYLLKGFEYFYGIENMSVIKEKLKRTIYFPYFSESDKKEIEIDVQYKKILNELKMKNICYSNKIDKEHIKESLKKHIIEDRSQSGVLHVNIEDDKSFSIILLDMLEYNFYPRLIHECIHVSDYDASDYECGETLSGFQINLFGAKSKYNIFNEYFTDKIAVDIFNYLLEKGCPILGENKKLDRTFLNSGKYWIPDVFMKDFYERYKKEICVGKLNNSDKIFRKILGDDATKKIKESCDILPGVFHFFASEADMNKAIAIRDECKKLVETGMKKANKR